MKDGVRYNALIWKSCTRTRALTAAELMLDFALVNYYG